MTHEAIPGIPTTDPGSQQDDEQGAVAPEEQGALPLEDPDSDAGVA
jgi:hypothetical protein